MANRSRPRPFKPKLLTLEDRVTPVVNLVIDYTYDSQGFFNDPARRAQLERAASTLTDRMTDSLLAIVPNPAAGDTWTMEFTNPGDGTAVSVPNPTVAADTFIIFAGGYDIPIQGVLGLGGQGGFTSSGGAFGDVVRARGQAGALSATPTDFASWGGVIRFDSASPFYVGNGPVPADQVDFYFVAVHELAHCLGIGGADSWMNQISGTGGANPEFTGPVSVAEFGSPVPVEPQVQGHFALDTMSDGVPVIMQPRIVSDAAGTQFDFTDLDFAALDDIGWEFGAVGVPPTAPGVPPSPPAAPTVPPLVQLPPTDPPIPAAPASSGQLAFGNLIVTGDGNVAELFDASSLARGGAGGASLTNSSFTGFGGEYQPFPETPGIVRGSVGDVDGDRFDDFVYVTGPGGGAKVRVISGADGSDLITKRTQELFPGEDLTNIGLFVAVGDINGDSRDEVVVSPDNGGGARIQVFNLVDGEMVRRSNFFGIDDPNFRGGGRIALGDVNNDGSLDLVVGAGFGGGPRVAVFDGRFLFRNRPPVKLFSDFFAFEPSLRDGVFIGAGDTNADGFADLAMGGGPGGAPRVMILSGRPALTSPSLAIARPLANFFAFDSNQRGGVSVAMKDVDGDRRLDLVVGSGQNEEARIKAYSGAAIAANGGAPAVLADVPVLSSTSPPLGVFVG